jgi:hypothetical protein
MWSDPIIFSLIGQGKTENVSVSVFVWRMAESNPLSMERRTRKGSNQSVS